MLFFGSASMRQIIGSIIPLHIRYSMRMSRNGSLQLLQGTIQSTTSSPSTQNELQCKRGLGTVVPATHGRMYD